MWKNNSLVEIVCLLKEANIDLDGDIHLVLKVKNYNYASNVVKLLRIMERRKLVVKIKGG
ncbi:hypothetical protein DRO53_04015 [Candidatus Bathyarchaeota archaeon]|nr:MAG: hypothetical protein DRO53_04015 [Candidatus Bathyarchaeota archaeon]